MRARSALILLLPLLASCSIALAKGPPGDPRNAEATAPVAPGSCSSTPTWGFIDAALSMMSFASGYIISTGRLGPDEARGEHIWLGAIVGGLFGVGASVGFRRADACEDFLDVKGFPGSVRAPYPASGEADPTADASLITAEELTEGGDSTVMAAVQRLRPQWLRRTGARSDPLSVVIDNQGFELDILESIRPEDVEWLRFFGPPDATLRWGTGYTSGAIQVHTRG